MGNTTRGLTEARYGQAYRAGIAAYRRQSNSGQEIDIDKALDAYTARNSVSPFSSLSHAWQDGWTNGLDYTASEFLAITTDPETIVLSGDYYLTSNDGTPNPIGSAPVTMVDPLADDLFAPYSGPETVEADMTCGACGGVWNSTEVPTPAARCPFEYDHEESDPTATAAMARILDSIMGETDREKVDKLAREFAYWAGQA